ncbi:hypothetical protein Hdeb2414_s0024g00654331 [Helianthus debilis subsp. tardiflorus]
MEKMNRQRALETNLYMLSTSGMAGSLIHESVTSKSVYLKPKKLMR